MRSLIVAAAATLLLGTAAADAYPTRPITIIVPYGPGGANDIVARQVAPKLHAVLGQPVIVDNRPGANGIVGMQRLVRAESDGHTIGIAPTSVLTINPWLYKDMGFDPAKDLAPITIAMSVPNVLVVSPKVPATSIEGLIDLLRKKPDSLSFASQGPGSTAHLSGELFKALAKVEMTHVPYKGSGPAMTDLVGGQVDMMFDNITTALPQVQAGALRMLGVGSAEPSPHAPGVPPIAKAIPGFESNSWFAFVGPSALPPAVVSRLHEAITAVLRLPDVAANLEKTGGTIVANTPAQFAATMREERERWGRVIEKAKVRIE
jgi:tripartite-type tricarboxylate transporter receptor subunit TctC